MTRGGPHKRFNRFDKILCDRTSEFTSPSHDAGTRRLQGRADADVSKDRSRRRMASDFGCALGRLARSGQNWAASLSMQALATLRLGSLEPGIVAQPAFMTISLR